MKINSSLSNSRKYKHSLMCTNSTTANFKDVQPLFCRMLLPNSKIDLNLDSYVRLAPLVFPTFGRLTSRYLAKFVPFEQIFPQMATFLSGMPVNLRTYQGVYNSVPQISNYALWQILTQSNGTKGFAIAQSFQNVTNARGNVSLNSCDFRRMPLEEFIMLFENDIKEFAETRTITDSMFVVNDSFDDDGNVVESHQYIDTFLIEAALDTMLNGLSLESAAEKWSVDVNVSKSTAEQMDIFEKVYNTADYVNVLSNSSSKIVTTYRLTERGRMLRKIFIGLGYQPSKSDKTTMSILPILAFYKAYFDAFYPKRLQNFADTWCYKFIDSCTLLPQITEGQFIFHGDNYPSTSDVKPYPTASVSEQTMYQSCVNNFTEFIKNELSFCYSTHDQDFFSLQTADINGNAVNMFDVDATMMTNSLKPLLQSNELAPKDGRNDSNSVDPTATSVSVSQPSLVPAALTSWSLSLLQRLQNSVNRNSLIGRNVERFVRSHYNSDVYNELYLSSRSVGSGSYDVSISDITSTAETSNSTTETGDYLGSYAGKGVGNGGMSVKFTADTFGYLIVLQWFEVETGYYFGTDPQHFYCGRLDMPSSEFDALGYEITPRSACWCDNGISYEGTDIASVIGNTTDSHSGQLTISNNDGFGFIPRFSRFKTSHNIVNGDFSRHGQVDALSPFYLDRKPVVRYLDFNNISGSTDKRVRGVFRPLPYASAEWQYNSRYDWLGDYNRVFYNGGSAAFKNGIIGGILEPQNDILLYGVDDNMLMHNVLRWSEINTLKPLAQSYDTYVGDDNNPVSTTPA